MIQAASLVIFGVVNVCTVRIARWKSGTQELFRNVKVGVSCISSRKFAFDDEITDDLLGILMKPLMDYEIDLEMCSDI